MREYDPLNDKVFEQVFLHKKICEAFINALMKQIYGTERTVEVLDVSNQTDVFPDILDA